MLLVLDMWLQFCIFLFKCLVPSLADGIGQQVFNLAVDRAKIIIGPSGQLFPKL